MTIRSGLEINRVTQFQTLLDRFRTHIEDIPDLSGDLSVCHIHLRTAKSIHENIHRFSHTDRIRHLYQHLIRHTGGNHILSDMTSGISSRTVYLRRVLSRESTTAMSEEKRLVSLMPFEHPVKVIEGEYLPKDYFEYVKGLENEPEGGKRCEKCFRLRLESSARYAKEHGFDYFTTTLTISPLKNAQLLNSIGAELGEKYGIPWLYSDFKKREGYKRSIILSKEYDLYRQNYCGCVFSKR